MKKSVLKHLIKEIIRASRGSTKGEWVEPNGKVHDVEDWTHWDWAEEYLKNSQKRFRDDPIEELIARGWMRVVYSYNESLIMVFVGNRRSSYLTQQQKEYLEDQSEERRWLVMDDDGYEIYRPKDCITTINTLQEDHGLGYSHNVTFDMTTGERDTLNDPRLNGKLDETYKFKDVDDVREPLRLPEGFGILTEVYYNNMYIGSIISTPNGYMIDVVETPKKKVLPVKRSKNNNFKSKNIAAEILHRLWKQQRTEQ